MNRRLFDCHSWLACFGLVLMSGCEATMTPAPVAPATSTTTASTTVAAENVTNVPATQAASTETAAADKVVSVSEMDWEQVQALVAEHKGKVVVVDVWSTACEPCLREFPHLVAIQKEHGNNVVGISFDCDYIGAKNKPVSYYRERVVKALTEMQADKLINVMANVAADELFVQMDLDSIPAVYVFDRDGKLSKRFDNRTPAGGDEEGISYEKQITPLVAELVKAPKP